MKWLTLLGRTGTVLIMVGLALVVVSLIPPATGHTSGSRGVIAPEKYRVDHSRIYTPQTGLQISVESTDSVHVYILGVSLGEFNDWTTQLIEAYPDLPLVIIDRYIMPLVFLREAHPDLDLDDLQVPVPVVIDLDEPQTTPIEDIMDMLWDIAVLDKGLQAYPEIVLWESPPSTETSHQFFPPDVFHVTVVVANPSPDAVEVGTWIRDLAALAANDRVIAAPRLLIPIGVVLAIPWLVSKKASKRTL